jgi:hypothetical protein
MCVWEIRNIDTFIVTSVREEVQSLDSRTGRLTPEEKSKYLQVSFASDARRDHSLDALNKR